ncbi:unnamed protein product [Paramecium primaurelia]|uniref:Ribosomal RNA small subunit methyltransferase NEP1 n=1 Tax=Paramecium primaurelia TaxID=5886 RepID=A0A8S1JUC5_PARPR|nr:unnamed protein product [Paramecium primaurelia]
MQQELLLPEDIEDKRQLIIVLEQAPLEIATIRQQIVLLNADEHKNYINQTLNKDYSLYRPDILHHCLLSLMDSPLNKAGKLKIYVHTAQNVILDISPKLKVPRTYESYAALFAQALHKLRVRAVESSETLIKVIKNPITDHLPSEALKIGTSTQAKLIDVKQFIKQPNLNQNKPIVYVIGAVSKGNPGMEAQYIDECICISQYSLSAGYCLQRISNAYEELWGIK